MIYRSRICRGCGITFTPATRNQMLCPNCSNQDRRQTREVACASCGKMFLTNGPRATYCPECRKERRAKAEEDFRRRRSQGNTRKIGSQDYCKLCGAKYTVEGGLQKYCRECSDKINKERQSEAAIKRYHEHKDEINPARNAKRRETPKERSLNTRTPSTSGSVAKNISRKKSGAFEVRCYRHNRSYYLGTYDTIDAATSARDRFLSSPDDADFVAVAAAIRTENSGRKQKSYLKLKGEKNEDRKL